MQITSNRCLSYFLVSLFFIFSHPLFAAQQPIINFNFKQEKVDLGLIDLDIKLNPNQFIYADSISLSINNPDLQLTNIEIKPITPNKPQMSVNDLTVLNDHFKIEAQLHGQGKGKLHFSYLLNQPKQVYVQLYDVSLDQAINPTTQTIAHQDQTILNKPINHQPTLTIWEKIGQFSLAIQDHLKNSKSNTLRLALVFLLGLLMSLTPCIYPMLPITAGILQAQGSSSMVRSFVLAFTYTLGTSTTFAVFGLIAALSGHLFGQLLVNPIFILGLIIILTYLGLSMFGLYDMYVPKFMASPTVKHQGGSLVSVFIFGAISGSIASPCLSPGLALLLSIVATLKSHFLGFILLFFFGLGLSVPLLIIGTFSNSINMLPQSGMWMVEIKKLFGFMLLAMCAYLLTNIIPKFLTPWVLVSFIFGSGVYYLQNASNLDSRKTYFFKNTLGCILIIIAVIQSMQIVYKTYLNEPKACNVINWLSNYEAALKIGLAEKQNVLIDIGAEWCSICKSIDKKVFNDPAVKQALCHTVLLKVDATDQHSEPYLTLKERYKIVGVPAILVINPENHALIKRWGSELYDMPISKFIEELQ